MINTKTIKIFLISLLLVFVMTALPRLVPSTNQLKSTVSLLLPKSKFMENIKPKLESKLNEFSLQKTSISTANLAANTDYEGAQAYVVIDYDSGQVLAEKNLSTKTPVASLTKIMTAVVSLDLADPEEEFTVSQKASSQQPTKVMLKPGEKYTFKHLLSSMLISSANDSAEVIKENIDAKYGPNTFISAMNQKAKFLGLKNTHFSNPQGFDDFKNYSSVEDLAILSHYAMQNYPLISQTVGAGDVDLTNGNDLRFYLNNWNGLLGVYPGVSGVKIGNTQQAGNCTVVLAEREGKKVMVVLLGTPGAIERDLWASRLLDLGFNRLNGLPPINVTEDQLRAKYSTWKYYG